MATSPFDLTGRVSVVTGAAAGGLGAHLARVLAEAGSDVVVADVDSRHDDVDETVSVVEGIGRRALGVAVDVADMDAVQALFDEAIRRLGPVDVVINCAGIMLRKPSLDMTLAEWQRVLDVNLTGTWIVAVCAARQMAERDRGKIVNVASQLGHRPGAQAESAYCASKAGVINLTRALAGEWAWHGIYVNAIAPGPFFPTGISNQLTASPERMQALKDRTMLGRFGEPAVDLTGAALLLASSASDYMTGQTIYVDGGWTAW